MGGSFQKLLAEGPEVINIGLTDFAINLKIQGLEVLQVNWAPPAGGDPEMVNILEELL